MSEIDFEFDAEEIKEFINKEIPPWQRATLFQALGESEEGVLNELGTTLTGERHQSGLVLHLGVSKDPNGSLWSAIKLEVFDLFCTQSARYKDERQTATKHFRDMVLIVATAIASTFHLALGVVVGAVSVAIMAVAKVGRNAWCAANKPKG